MKVVKIHLPVNVILTSMANLLYDFVKENWVKTHQIVKVLLMSVDVILMSADVILMSVLNFLPDLKK